MKTSLLFVITQLYRGGAETALINLLSALSSERYEADLLVLNMPNATNALLDQVPAWVRLCDAGAENQPKRLQLTTQEFLLGGEVARAFVRDKVYDFAFSYGEWCSPDWVANYVQARCKCVWIHTDITAAPSFQPRTFFDTFYTYAWYIFVSEGTRQRAMKRYPFLCHKSVVLHNCLDREALVRLAQHTTEVPAVPTHGVKLITVANVRAEKGYQRMVDTARLLAQQGLDFTWLCIGSTPDASLLSSLRKQIAAYGLETRFQLLGFHENPYPYVCQADAFILLSDYEAWPLAMAEAMLLGIPPIATDSAGAREHIRHGENGLLCGFDPSDAAQAIQRYCTDQALADRLRLGVAGFQGSQSALQEFDAFINQPNHRKGVEQ